MEKYVNHNAVELLRHSSKAMGELVDWMLANLGEYEQLHVGHWTDSWFYVQAIDTRKDKFITRQRFGLTVDVAKGKILWNDKGGNCFVRAQRWKKRQRVKNIPQGRIHVYKDWTNKNMFARNFHG